MDSNNRNFGVPGLSDDIGNAAFLTEAAKSDLQGVSNVAPVAVLQEIALPSIDSIRDAAGTETGNVGSGATIDDVRPIIQGHGGEPGTIIEIHDQKGELVALSRVGPLGEWSARITPDQTLAAGEHVFTAVTEGGVVSEPFTLNVDIPASSRPTIDAVFDNAGVTGEIANGDTTDDRNPMLRGHGEPNTSVGIYIDGALVEYTLVDANGSWEYSVRDNNSLSSGEHEFKVSVLGIASEPFVLTVGDTETVLKPVIDSAFDDVGAPAYVANGGNTDDATPFLQGHGAQPFGLLSVYDGSTRVGYAYADGNGSWSFDVKNALASGEHSFTVVEAGVSSDAFVLNITAANLHKPVIDSAFDDFGSVGIVANGSNTDDATPLLQGHGAQPFGLLSVYDGSTRVGYAYADGNGNWSFDAKQALTSGEHSFTVVEAGVSSDAFVLNITAPDSHKPVIDSAFDDFGTIGYVANGGNTDDAAPFLQGHGAQPFGLLSVYDGSTRVGYAYADGNGSWSFDVKNALASGEHAFTVVEAGVSSDAFVLNITAPDAAKLAIDTVIDNVGTVEALINGATTDDARPSFHGHGEPNTDVYLFDHGVFAGSGRVEADGSWVLNVDRPLASGEHEFSVGSTDASGTSEPFRLTVENAPEAPRPVIESAIDDVGVTGVIGNGDSTDDVQPVFHGHADADASRIAFFDDGKYIGETAVRADGSWTFELLDANQSVVLHPGDHSITASTDGLVFSDPFVLHVVGAATAAMGGQAVETSDGADVSGLSLSDLLQSAAELFAGEAQISPFSDTVHALDLSSAGFGDSAQAGSQFVETTGGVSAALPAVTPTELWQQEAAQAVA
ncbi:putative outer membrane adhesin like protein domain protein [Collimonas fungivorans]|uniref:Putative outer membrane adhesin like protein domain protein n=1 Tax=Collimonas fungivorans TaxID=158899 RepID=A0A127P970_9BURK|nr:Ig-like domain-containing protein [Collimonas fungivorans]AMO94362.1 putative outer membrane adhesin like protein domain protein [Collimonas fungivorans]